MTLLYRFGLCVFVTITLPALAEDPASEPTPTTLQATFNALYPDLKSHEDIVAAAIMALDAEGFQARSTSALLDTIATRARANVQRANRTLPPAQTIDPATFKKKESAARAEALRLFPELANWSSPLYVRLMEERTRIAKVYPDYFSNPEWPLMLTNSCIAMMTLENRERKEQQQVQDDGLTASMDLEKQRTELHRMLQNLQRPHSRPQ